MLLALSNTLLQNYQQTGSAGQTKLRERAQR